MTGTAAPARAVGVRAERIVVEESADLAALFHRLNNQLGIILANAELLETRLTDETARARAGQIVSSVIEAMATARELRSSASRSR